MKRPARAPAPVKVSAVEARREHFVPAWCHDRSQYVHMTSASASTWVSDILGGRLRIPRFQRQWVWTDEQILHLLDSLMQGYGTGAMLLWERYDLPVPSVQRFGEVEVVCDKPRGLIVVDGQQRLSALATACVAERFWLDMMTGQFLVGEAAPYRVSVSMLFMPDAIARLEWFDAHADKYSLPREMVFDCYCASIGVMDHTMLNAMVVPSEWTPDRVIETFLRINTAGTPVAEAELRAALETGDE